MRRTRVKAQLCAEPNSKMPHFPASETDEGGAQVVKSSGGTQACVHVVHTLVTGGGKVSWGES
jgi:hypothetical protein